MSGWSSSSTLDGRASLLDYEVEFFAARGETIGVVTVLETSVREATADGVLCCPHTCTGVIEAWGFASRGPAAPRFGQLLIVFRRSVLRWLNHDLRSTPGGDPHPAAGRRGIPRTRPPILSSRSRLVARPGALPRLPVRRLEPEPTDISRVTEQLALLEGRRAAKRSSAAGTLAQRPAARTRSALHRRDRSRCREARDADRAAAQVSRAQWAP